ncbi:hypothetical protein [uncultured Gimesia sp.]|uniref:hypothetical protein n=1 Tax=uncultured Gimesia sp. TaxID=1678688 RepID=UPI002609A2FD|nr:hypothetical protein [uncultured Gimesia sp.]
MTTSAYIEDGYTETGYMQESPGIHQAVRFEFRPVMPVKIREVLEQWGSISAAEKTKRINNLIIDNLIKWDLLHKGNSLPITAEVLSRLKQPFVDRLFNIITYSDMSDKDLAAKQDEAVADTKN